jgi:hypothetical protein
MNELILKKMETKNYAKNWHKKISE